MHITVCSFSSFLATVVVQMFYPLSCACEVLF